MKKQEAGPFVLYKKIVTVRKTVTPRLVLFTSIVFVIAFLMTGDI